MNNEDALLQIQSIPEKIWNQLSPSDEDAMEMAFKALEKQVPMPVRITTSTKRCGRCNRQLSGIGNIHPKRLYCQGCGQAIKWSEEE